MTPEDREQLCDDLVLDEGERLLPYVDIAGKTTIGVGRNLTDNGISTRESRLLLEADVARALIDANTYSWFAGLSGARQRAIANMLFNLGHSRFEGFRDLKAALARGHYEAAALAMLDSAWARQVGKRADRLAELMRHG